MSDTHSNTDKAAEAEGCSVPFKEKAGHLSEVT